MNIIDNLKNVWAKAEKLTEKELSTYRTMLIILVLADMLGIYWYLGLVKLGLGLMVVLLGILSVIFILQSRLPPKNTIPEVKGGKKKMEESKNDKDDSDSGDFGFDGLNMDMDIGLPGSNEYTSRLNKALGCW